MTLDPAAQAADAYDASSRRDSGLGRAWWGGRGWARFFVSWALALTILGFGVPRALNLSWHVVVPALESLRWAAVATLVVVWLLGLYVHSFLLTAAAPGLTRRRAITLNVTGSAVANVVPVGGAVGLELNRRMMKGWGIDARGFTGYVLLINLWGTGCKLLLPVVAVLALGQADQTIGMPVRVAAVTTGTGFVAFAAVATAVLSSPRSAVAVGRALDRAAGGVLRLLHRERDLDLARVLLDLRHECGRLVAVGWLKMFVGITGYVALQCLLLGLCLHLTAARTAWPAVLAGFAVERTITLMPITPGGIGVGDLGLVGVLLAQGGAPAGVTAAAVLYRAFVFAVQIPVGGCILGLWLLGRHLRSRQGRVGAELSAVGGPGCAGDGASGGGGRPAALRSPPPRPPGDLA